MTSFLKTWDTPLFRASFCLVMVACGSNQRAPKSVAETSRFCSDPTHERVEMRQGQEHRWCEDKNGLIHGPVTVFYAGGQQKLKFHMNRGQPAGDYIAWHQSGRWAVKAHYSNGDLAGASHYRPPHGPPSKCVGQSCSGMQAVIDRPFCLLGEIETVFAESTARLNTCVAQTTELNLTHFTAHWTISLAGQTETVEVSTEGAISSASIECLGHQIESFKFPAPMGQPCDVTLDFALGFKRVRDADAMPGSNAR